MQATPRRPRRPLTVLLATLPLIAAATACGGGTSNGSAGDGTGTIEVWYHSGQGPERDTLQQQVKAFHAAQKDVKVKLKLLPEGSYNDQVQAASAAGSLPDLLDFDGPLLHSYVYKGKLTPLDELLPTPLLYNLTDAVRAQGTFDKKLYSVGSFDSGLGMYGNKKLLDAADVDYPKKLNESWTAAEFTAALKKLAAHHKRQQILDLGMSNGKGEWFTYGYGPIVWSAGGDFITRQGNLKANGVLNTPEVAKAFTILQSWKPNIDPDTDGTAFSSGKAALSWNGHWNYPNFEKALGKDLVVLPLPDFGNGTKTGQGSWNWGITKSSKNQKAAAEFLSFLMKDDQVAATVKANGAIPGTISGLSQSDLYDTGQPLERFAHQLDTTCGTGPIDTSCIAVPRPSTPAYPVITSAFQTAFENIYDGGDPKEALGKAAKEIDTDIADNDGYVQP
ncbi:ABC transporter substrate-binding protein [Streptomyces rubiginosohelvolus]|uniref:ABC transporter substrate-binding protein n=1 Tax=Streptomyces rubiginosohelvolus TaxID=67362 RepID=UPI003692FA9C